MDPVLNSKMSAERFLAVVVLYDNVDDEKQYEVINISSLFEKLTLMVAFWRS